MLVLASDAVSSSIRLEPYLACLFYSGAIEGYCFFDRDLAAIGPHRYPEFTHVIAQRNISSSQKNWLARSKAPFVYEIDDLLTGLPARAGKDDARTRSTIGWCLENASAVITPGKRLARLLEKATGVAFLERHHELPNGLWPPALDPSRWARPARTFLWVSSDLPLITLEAPDFPARIAETVARLGLHPVLIGKFPVETLRLFPMARRIAGLSFPDFRRLLSVLPAPVAIAPLPLAAGQHQAVTDAKSDIKVVDFQGHGIPALYSGAAPYRESDLKPPMLLDNAPDQWTDALAEMAARPDLAVSSDAVARVHRLRAYGEISPVLQAAMASAATSVIPPRRSANAMLRKAETRLRSWRKRMQGRGGRGEPG